MSGIVDVTECPIELPQISEWEYWSGKKNKHTLKYELVCSFIHPQIVWCNGPFKGSVHDLTIARSDLIHLLNEGEALLADKAYLGEECFITPHRPARTETEKQFDAIVNKHRQRIERINKRIKHFRSVKEIWRHDISLHHFVFIVVTHITNINLIEKPL